MNNIAERQQVSSSHSQPYELKAGAVAKRLGCDLESGLSAEAVAKRYESDGWNELPVQPGVPQWLLFLRQFHQPLLYILLIAGAIKAVLGSWTNAGVIWGVTVLNALIGYVQESKAEGAIASLSRAVTTEANVLRDGQMLQIPSRELVVGDVVSLTSGDKVPADIRLFKVRSLQIDESALTGESVPVEKSSDPVAADTPLAERINMAYAGGFVTFGQGQGIVTATATATEMGQISQSMAESQGLVTPLTRKFAAFSRLLLYIVLALATFTFAVGLGRGGSLDDMFEAAVALAVSAIPEGLPAVVTITLAIGVNRMAQRHVIVRKLPAVETLGSATVICSDKTGTLTENQMTVQMIWSGENWFEVSGGGYGPEGDIVRLDGNRRIPLSENLPSALKTCLLAGVLCNDARLEQTGERWSVIGDPTEGALLAAAVKAEITQAELTAQMPRLDAIPFESQYQYMATLHKAKPEVIYVKGSVEAILSRCQQMLDAQGKIVALDRAAVEAAVDDMAMQALRVLAFAYRPVDGHIHAIEHEDISTELVFVGLQGMIDPPRPEAVAAIQACQRAGIQVKMITGDHISTARAIAQRMGIQQSDGVVAFEGRDLTQMDDRALSTSAEQGDVFARVAPAQKLRLVEALQTKGDIVAMTGDGVNDAPALKQADLGIAMGRGGTEVAREAADMLLTDDNFVSIEAAVEEGRTVYQNLRKAIAFLLPVNGGESMTILISALLARDLPILSLQVLWLNLINSLTMTVPLAFEPKSSSAMKRPPNDPNKPLITRHLLKRILLVSLFNWVLIFGMFEWAARTYSNVPIARTMAIQALVAARIVYLLSISHVGEVAWDWMRGRIGTMKNALFLMAGIGGAIALQIVFSQLSAMNFLFETAPLSWQQWLICLLPAIPMVPFSALVNRVDPND